MDDVRSVRSRASSQASRRSGRREAPERPPGRLSRVQSAGSSALARTPSMPRLPLGHGEQPPSSRGGSFYVPLGNLPFNNIPGYTGYVPGKQAENILGATHTRANALALAALSRQGEPAAECPYAARTNHYGLTNRRMGGDVPGYTGFIPGKHSEQVLGTTFANSNANAQEVQRWNATTRTFRAPHLPEGGPMCWSGSHAALVSAGSVAPLGAPQA